MSHGQAERKPRRFPLQLDQIPAGASAAAAARASREVLRPQAPLQQAVQDRLRQTTPQGVGLDSAPVRQRMVKRLSAEGIDHPGLLDAFARVPRHLFVDTALVNQAYEDTSLPIGLGQTISKPSVVAAMIQLLCVRPGLSTQAAQAVPRPDLAARPLGNCLEIGTGCGYQAALLAHLSRQVVSIERLRDLHLKARHNLDALRRSVPGWPDVRLVYGDGMIGHAPQAPYDTLIAAAGGSSLPQAWLDQLAPGGRLVAPTDDGRQGQVLVIVDRLPDGSLKHSRAGAVLFVPLKSGMT
ncbi:MAG: protein-L-isoaspartate O-methyltransferase [Burkholderiales bacterium]|nr:protein-L-isoaspartate O-methyltransferase [Burkholderiales bacterium]MBH2017661.1 protein-L-isoaspartate O-methyltransferase [Burkholderiales bacterium]